MGRPQFFTIDPSHQLARGLVFAGLGNAPGSVRYHDSSVFGNHGTLLNVAPSVMYTYSNTLQRPCLSPQNYDSKGSMETLVPLLSVDASLAVWFKGASSAGFPCIAGTSTASYDDFRFLVRMTNTGAILAYVMDGSASLKQVTFTGSNYAVLSHYCIVASGITVYLYINGQLVNQTTKSAGLVNTAGFAITKQYGRDTAYGHWANVADTLYYNRALSPSEIRLLADPSNYMLSGMIKPIGQASNIYDLAGIR